MVRTGHLQRLLQQIRVATSLQVASMSGVLAGCGGHATVDTSDIDDAGPAGSGGSLQDASRTKDSSAGSDPGFVWEAGSTFDAGAAVDATAGEAGADCKYAVLLSEPVAAGSLCASSNYVNGLVCLRAPPAGSSCQQHYGTECVLSTYGCGLATRAEVILCELPSEGITPSPGACCYVLGSGCPIGRPFFVAGTARTAPLVEADGWSCDLQPDLATLDTGTRSALAEFWTQEALREHASVAAFARFVLQCLSVGAPAEIVGPAVQACAEEVEHARVAFGLASAYAGRAVGPGPLDITGALSGVDDLAQIAVTAAAEGCIAETIASLIARAAHEAARDPTVSQALCRIADEEAAHALLAWRFVAWVIRGADRKLRRRLAQTFEAAELHVGLGPLPTRDENPDLLKAHGCLPVEERRAIARLALDAVVRPAFQDLLSSIEDAARDYGAPKALR